LAAADCAAELSLMLSCMHTACTLQERSDCLLLTPAVIGQLSLSVCVFHLRG
jgi:hypothetical protein